jgi:disulfide bond formation protein DsbB
MGNYVLGVILSLWLFLICIFYFLFLFCVRIKEELKNMKRKNVPF